MGKIIFETDDGTVIKTIHTQAFINPNMGASPFMDRQQNKFLREVAIAATELVMFERRAHG